MSGYLQAMSHFFAKQAFLRLRRTMMVTLTRLIATHFLQARLFAQFMDSLPEDADRPYMQILSPMAQQEAGY